MAAGGCRAWNPGAGDLAEHGENARAAARVGTPCRRLFFPGLARVVARMAGAGVVAHRILAHFGVDRAHASWSSPRATSPMNRPVPQRCRHTEKHGTPPIGEKSGGLRIRTVLLVTVAGAAVFYAAERSTAAASSSGLRPAGIGFLRSFVADTWRAWVQPPAVAPQESIVQPGAEPRVPVRGARSVSAGAAFGRNVHVSVRRSKRSGDLRAGGSAGRRSVTPSPRRDSSRAQHRPRQRV